MNVFHSSNVKIEILKAGSHVTPNIEISKCFGKDKPGNVHYLHVFSAELADYPRAKLPDGRLILDINAGRVGELELAKTPDGEDWENYKTLVDLVPIGILEY